ncbi:hypothetical protein RHOSPDRAFT_37244 [Rhodotorula sp. JG-1b]|nr:hypothetical protein RHOSPDRAFT_37244 [Rhodotorula sp. JG-1b]
MAASESEKPRPVSRKTRRKGIDRLQSLPLELLLLIASHISEYSDANSNSDQCDSLTALLALSTVSHSWRSLILSPPCEGLWLAAIEKAGLPELEAPPPQVVQYANLAVGRQCKMCTDRVGRKVEYHLRNRLCSKCWEEELVYEGPDEPDPAFEDFFPGTKRYTPRSRTGKGWKKQKAFFFLHMLESTSAYLATLFAPQIASYQDALKTDPLAELDDFLAHSALAPPLQRELDARADWVRRCWRDGEKLERWEAERKRRKREAVKAAKGERANEAPTEGAEST